jgi:hypothetical protein
MLRQLASVLASLLLVATPLSAQLPPPSPATIVAGLAPGDWIRATLTTSADSNRMRDSTVEGTLLTLGSAGVSLRLEDGAEHFVPRRQLARLEARRGRSRWKPALFGYLAALPVSLVICSGDGPECDKGSIPPLIGGLIGYLIGRTSWQEVRLP